MQVENFNVELKLDAFAKSILDLVRHDFFENSEIASSVRELSCVYARFNDHGKHTCPKFSSISVSAYEKLMSGEITKRGQLRFDHKLPFNITLNNLRSATTVEEVRHVLDNEVLFTGITLEEDAQLDANDLKSKLPTNGQDRYEYVGIEIKPGLHHLSSIMRNNLKKLA